jgi:2-oxo-4-hydroxy-4-carboxy-5-ureidoimidazoline decarboxylase
MTESDREAFVRRYGGIYEHSPWVADEAWPRAVGMPAGELPGLFASVVDSADGARRLALIRAHPDLAGRAAIGGELTEASTAEQASARLDQCTPEEYREFQRLNHAYREKFGFPFVMAVRNRSRPEILAAFRSRLDSSVEEEFRTALEEIHKIARMRFEAL